MADMSAAVSRVWEALRGVQEPKLRQIMVAREMSEDIVVRGRFD